MERNDKNAAKHDNECDRLLDCGGCDYVLPMYEYVADSQVSMFWTPFAEGGDTRGYAKRHGLFDTKTALDIVRQVTSALDHMHARDVAHFDIKPDNILVRTKDIRDGVWLADLGLAQKLRSPDAVVRCGGTVGFMGPEVWDGRAGLASDVYALGWTMVELLCGFDQLALYRHDKAVRQGSRSGASFAALQKFPRFLALPRCVQSLIGSMVQVNPRARPKASEVLQRIDDCLDAVQGAVKMGLDDASSSVAQSMGTSTYALPAVSTATRLSIRPSTRPRPSTVSSGGASDEETLAQVRLRVRGNQAAETGVSLVGVRVEAARVRPRVIANRRDAELSGAWW